MKRFILPLMMFAMAITSCTQKDWKKSGNGILIDNGKQALLLEVMSPSVIHVFASGSRTIPGKKSLILQEVLKPGGSWSVKEQSDSILLRTDSLQVWIDRKSLGLSFMKADGSMLLKEFSGGGKTFTEDSVNGEKVLAVRQVFEYQPGEAVYGLGQHQDRLLNLRGHAISFHQRNREIFVPFLLSSKGYGILWDNYSYTRFGSLEPAQEISENLWYDQSGKYGGLDVQYFSDPDMKKKLPFQQLSAVPFELPGEIRDKLMAVRYEGELEIPEAGLYQFENRGKQCFRLWIDGLLVRDYWSSFVLATDYTRLELEKRKYKIKIEWSRNADTEFMELRWRTPAMQEDQLSLWSQAGQGIDYYFVYGASADKVIAGYRDLTGTAPILPRWAYGFWQSRERYQSQDELINIVKEFRKRRVPLDVIVQDWHYWEIDKWGSQAFDKARFPDARAAIANLHELNARILISVWPKYYPMTENFREMNKRGFLYPANLEDSTRDWLGYVSTFYDAYNPEARDLFWSQLSKEIVPSGVDGWWLDAAEPELIGDASPEELARRMSPNYFGSGTEYLNAFSMFNSKGIYENQRKANPEDRVCILTRSAFAGQQRYAAISWSGDVSSRWDVLKAQLAAGLSFSISGIPYWTSDIGAFSVDFPGGNANREYRELFTRWYQFGTFCPVFRVHGTNTPREIWFFGDPGDPEYDTQLRFDKLRYQLLPYTYSLAGSVFLDHYTIMRPLVMDFPKDEICLNTWDQYMYGPAFLVCPITDKGFANRAVYLPQGGWFDFWDGHYYDGGYSISASSPSNSMPLFVRAGSILPLGPDLQYTGEKSADTIKLLAYTGSSAEFTLYEDEGLNYNYEQAAYSRIPIRWNEAEKTLKIGDRKGEFPGMLEKRTFQVYFILKAGDRGYDALGEPDAVLHYTGTGLITIAP